MNKIHHIIGDIHGHGISLVTLLIHLGYVIRDGVYQHPGGHQVVFLGDFIDRGPTHREVIDTVRPMVEAGHALAVMGNHEFNAVCYHMPDGAGGFLRQHNTKNSKQHEAFLQAYPDEVERQGIVDWFKTLPLWLETEEFRVVHACWHHGSMDVLKPFLNENNCLTDGGYVATSIKDSAEYNALEVLIKGVEAALPDGQSFSDKDGNKRRHIRTKWWDSEAKTYQTASIPENIVKDNIGETPAISRPGYPVDAKPLFIGHYWFTGDPAPLLDNLACVDYSIGKNKPGKASSGKLVAYAYSGETTLSADHFIGCK